MHNLILLIFWQLVVISATSAQALYTVDVRSQDFVSISANGATLNLTDHRLWAQLPVCPEGGNPFFPNVDTFCIGNLPTDFKVKTLGGLDTFFFSFQYRDTGGGGLVLANESGATLLRPIDMQLGDRGVPSSQASSSVLMLVEGERPNRKITFEWMNASPQGECCLPARLSPFFGDTASYVNMQIRLYEGTSKIEYHYGDIFIKYPFMYTQGGFVQKPTAFLAYTPYDAFGDRGIESDSITRLHGDPLAPQLTRINNDDYSANPDSVINYVFDELPPSGTVYSFALVDTLSTAAPEPLTAAQNLRFYPNPLVGDELYVTPPGGYPCLLRIYDDLGRLHVESLLQGPSGVSTEGMPPGGYIIRTTDVNGRSAAARCLRR